MRYELNDNKLLGKFITDTEWKALPQAVRRKIRMCMLDSLGATLVGTLTPISQTTADYAMETWPGDHATILLHGKASTIGAAFANGYAANGLDIDDCALYTKGHPGAQVFPTALAISEKLGLSGREMLSAMVIGYEIAHRAARCWHDHHKIYQACGSWGSVACAAVASNLLGLPLEQINNALGIAEYHAPNLPMMRDIDHPTMVKHGIGWGAMTGITAANLAKLGLTGIPGILSFRKYRDWVADIGKHYVMIDGVIWKEYACCAWAHASLDAIRMLVQKLRIKSDDIARIKVEGFHEAIRLGSKLPDTTEEAQFNLAWPLAALLVYDEVGPGQMLESRFKDPKIQDVVSKIVLVESEELNRLYRLVDKGDPKGKYASVVTVTLKDSKQFSSGMVESKIRYPQPDWDEQRVEEKFRWLMKYVLDEPRTDRLVDMAWHFEDVDDAHKLTKLLTRK
jgi:2-methylcitrate dehydratase PrpD